MSSFIDSIGQHLFTHSALECLGSPACVIHKPSNHHMASWPQVYRHDINRMDRTCPHSIEHPDPDEINLDQPGRAAHHCDGCCTPPLV